MTRILICEDDAVLRQKLVEYFAQVGRTSTDLEGGLKMFAEAFRSATRAVESFGLGLGCLGEGVPRWERERNHPDGWYRKFYSEACGHDVDVNFKALNHVHRRQSFRPISGPLHARVNNKNYTRFLARQSSVV